MTEKKRICHLICTYCCSVQMTLDYDLFGDRLCWLNYQGQGQGFFICHIIVIQGITRSEMQSNQVRSVDSAKQ